MTRLALVVHSEVDVDAAVPPKQWRLNDRGRELCEPLAEALEMHRLNILLSSDEPKAVETATLVATRLGIETEVARGLDEHRRPFVPAGFEAAMGHFFAQPDERVFGEESAAEARDRFRAAVDAALQQHAVDSAGIVAHATVISLYAAPFFHVGPAALWQRLDHPSFVVVDTATNSALRIVDEIG
jgi:broad specificity phosphatase PhoE